MPSKVLEKYLSNYHGIDDIHLEPLYQIRTSYDVKRVLYPGSWIHLTPSLVFPFVVYVDYFKGMEKMFTNPELLEYIYQNSKLNEKPIIKFHKADYKSKIKERNASFDLLISLSSGFVSQACGLFLRKKGFLFVNNEHYDAIMTYTDPKFQLFGVFTYSGKYIIETKKIQEYFLTNKNQKITVEMVEENSKRSPSKAKYKLKKKAAFYLFQKI